MEYALEDLCQSKALLGEKKKQHRENGQVKNQQTTKSGWHSAKSPKEAPGSQSCNKNFNMLMLALCFTSTRGANDF